MLVSSIPETCPKCHRACSMHRQYILHLNRPSVAERDRDMSNRLHERWSKIYRTVGGRREKWCSGCKKFVDTSNFKKKGSGLKHQCNACMRIYIRKYNRDDELRLCKDCKCRMADSEFKNKFPVCNKCRPMREMIAEARIYDYKRRHKKRYLKMPKGRMAHKAAKWRRKALKRKAEGKFTAQEWIALCEAYGNKCIACGEVRPLTVDHIKPLSKGGRNDISNIQPLCHSCNSKKCDREQNFRLELIA